MLVVTRWRLPKEDSGTDTSLRETSQGRRGKRRGEGGAEEKEVLGSDGLGGVAMLTVGSAAQASLLGAKKVKLPGPSISCLRLARSEYIWVVVAPTTARVL